MNYTEMLFNRDERLVNLLNQADSKNLELIEEINNREDEIERLNNKIQDLQADYGNKAQVERDLLKEENKRLNNIIKEVRDTLEKYRYTKVEEYEKIVEFYKKIESILNKGE